MNSASIKSKGFFASLIGKKTLMSLTGLFLCLFLVIHMTGNLQLFKNDGGKAFNEYSVFMTSFPPIKIVSYLLYFSILAHAIDALILTIANRKARPVGYQANKPKANSHWTSRNMGLLGSILLFFIIIHMKDFWYTYKFGYLPYVQYTTDLSSGAVIKDAYPGTIAEKMISYQPDANTQVVVVKDLYEVVATEFKEPAVVIIYLISLFALAFHLFHGFQSGFQTLGINHPKYTPIIRWAGNWLFAFVIPALFAAMPLYFLLFHKD